MNAQLTRNERAAMETFRDLFPVKRCKTLRLRNWKEALTIAWLNDWEEQRGTLRSLRNNPRFDSIADILKAFDAE